MTNEAFRCGLALTDVNDEPHDQVGAFAYRFNRRFDLADLVVRLVVCYVCQGKATPERVIRHA